MEKPLAGTVALVAGATRGAGRGIAVQLGAAGATVYCTGRTTRTARSEMNRPETIEETAARVGEAGGRGVAVQVDHLVSEEVRALVARIEDEQGALHILVNDIFGATRIEWNKSVWESDLDYGLRTVRLAVDTHAITSHFAIPLLIRTRGGLVVEVNDGTAESEANFSALRRRSPRPWSLSPRHKAARVGHRQPQEPQEPDATAVVTLTGEGAVGRVRTERGAQQKVRWAAASATPSLKK